MNTTLGIGPKGTKNNVEQWQFDFSLWQKKTTPRVGFMCPGCWQKARKNLLTIASLAKAKNLKHISPKVERKIWRSTEIHITSPFFSNTTLYCVCSIRGFAWHWKKSVFLYDFIHKSRLFHSQIAFVYIFGDAARSVGADKASFRASHGVVLWHPSFFIHCRDRLKVLFMRWRRFCVLARDEGWSRSCMRWRVAAVVPRHFSCVSGVEVGFEQ